MPRAFKGKIDNDQGRGNEAGRLSKRVKVDGQSSSQSAPDIVVGGGAADRGPAISTTFSLQDASDASTKRRTRKRGDMLCRVEINDPALVLQDRLTTEAGQLEENPYYTHEQAREAAKREYNRRNAARGRIRRKSFLSELQDKCALMDIEMQALKKENAALKAAIEEMKQVAGTPGLNDSAWPVNNSADILQHGIGLHLPHVGGREILLQQERFLTHQSILNSLLHQHRPVFTEGLSTARPSRLGSSIDQQLLQTIIISQARAALDTNIDPTPDVTLQGGDSSNFLPK